MLRLSSRKFEMTKSIHKESEASIKQAQCIQNELEIEECEFEFETTSLKANETTKVQNFDTNLLMDSQNKFSSKTTNSCDGDIADKET